jgi:hypothetical protein
MKNALEVQGDVALRPAQLPAGATKIEHRPLAWGEVSGHAHVVQSKRARADNFDLYELNGRLFVAVGSDGAQLRHVRLKTNEQADHNALDLAPDTVYEVILQNEFNPLADAFERVLD